MKRIISALIVLTLILSVFCSCTGSGDADTTAASTDTAATKAVTITLNKSSFTENFDEKSYFAEIDNIDGLSRNTDAYGNYVLNMTDAAYKELRNKRSQSVKDAFSQSEANAESFIQRIEYDEDFRNVKVYADRTMYLTAIKDTPRDNETLTLATLCNAYQMFTVEGMKTHFKIFYSDDESLAYEFEQPLILV